MPGLAGQEEKMKSKRELEYQLSVARSRSWTERQKLALGLIDESQYKAALEAAEELEKELEKMPMD